MMDITGLSKEELIERFHLLNKELMEYKTKQKYGIVWEDSEEELDTKNVIPMVEPVKELNVGNVTDDKLNYLIEGDNYHSLKVLKNTHQNKIDVIYIDPPYNTGNEFVYNDRIVDKKDKFRHSKWLSFMDKRLRLARELMSEDGVIYVSIDDNEQAPLKLLMDNIFGEKNYLGQFVWRSTNGSNMGKNIVTVTEYILVYGKTSKVNLQGKEVERAVGMNHKDEHFEERGYFAKDNLDSKRQANHYSESLNYGITAPDGTILYPGNSPENNGYNWLWSKTKVEWGIENDFIIIEKNKNGEWKVYNKRYQKVNNKGEPFIRRSVIKNIIELKYASTSDGTRFMSEIGLEFDYTKPLNIIKDFISYHPNKNCTVLDFFAGSGTTGHAVMELNNEDGGNRNFILCTNNEVSDEKIRQHFIKKGVLDSNTKSAFNKFKKHKPELIHKFYQSEDYVNLGIARSVTRERIKRVIDGYETTKGDLVEGLGGNLQYLKTIELSNNPVYDSFRNQLRELAYVSHCLKYPNYIYNNHLVDNEFNINSIKNNGKINTFLVDKMFGNIDNILNEINIKFGNDIIIEQIEKYM